MRRWGEMGDGMANFGEAGTTVLGYVFQAEAVVGHDPEGGRILGVGDGGVCGCVGLCDLWSRHLGNLKINFFLLIRVLGEN